MPGSLCVQTRKGVGKSGRVGRLTSMSNAWNIEELRKDQRCGFLGELPAFLLGRGGGEGRSGLWSPSQPWHSLHDAGKVKTTWIYRGQWSVKGNLMPSSLPAPSTGKIDHPTGHLLICHKRGPSERW